MELPLDVASFYIEEKRDVHVRNQIISSGHRNYINPPEYWRVMTDDNGLVSCCSIQRGDRLRRDNMRAMQCRKYLYDISERVEKIMNNSLISL